MKKIAVFVMLAALTFFWLPAESTASAQKGKNKAGGMWGHSQDYRGRHKGTWRKKDSHGYRNYGQYRRTQVGNRRTVGTRRYRMVNRSFWEDGIRRSRLVRVYY